MKNHYQDQAIEKSTLKVPLREEALLVQRYKRKIGDVIIRKKIETRFVSVPIRREVLVIEKVVQDKDTEKIIEIDLKEEDIPSF